MIGSVSGRVGDNAPMSPDDAPPRAPLNEWSEWLLHEAVRVGRIGIFDHDQVAGTVFWSPEQRAIYGIGDDELITLDLFLGLLRPEDRAAVGEAVLRAHDPAGDGRFDVEHGIVRRDGRVRWLTTRSQTFFAGDGAARRPIRTIGAVIDVTEERIIAAEQAALRRVAEAVAGRTGPDEVFALIAREVAAVIGAGAAGVARRADGGAVSILGAWPGEADAAGLEDAFRRIGAEDAPSSQARGAIAVPVRVAQADWGALIALAPPGSPLPDDAERPMAGFARLAAISVSEASAWERVRERAAQQEALRQISHRALTVPLGEMLDHMTDLVAATLGATWVDVCEHEPAREELRRRAHGGQDASADGASSALCRRASMVALEDGPFVSADVAADPRFRAEAGAIGAGGSAAGVPIGRDGDLWGALVVYADRPGGGASDDDMVFLAAVANVLSSAVERGRADEALRHQAMHDPLTGIANRALLHDRLTHALRRGLRFDRRTAVIFCDIDHFKDVNDVLGHGAADRLLVQVAQRLTAAVRPGDTVARLGGDEFVIVCEDLVEEAPAFAVANRVLECFSAPFDVGEGFAITASIGIAVCGAERDADEALRDSDTAMYRAKSNGRGRIELFDQTMREHLLERIRISGDIRHGLERDEFVVHYQPQISLATGAMVGVEALLRWNHPTRGLLAPGTFIPIAEETGAIVPLGRLVLRQACADAARWNALRPDSGPLEVSVNISARQLSDPGLVDVVRSALGEWSLPEGQIGVEITESVLLDDDPEHVERVVAIKELGVRLLLDDFGTGYSSLAYIQRLSFDALKIDRSFVGGLGESARDSAIVAAVVRMAQALGVRVIVEGVETAGQVAALQALDCPFAQGFYFARPAADETISAWLQCESPWIARLHAAAASGARGESEA